MTLDFLQLRWLSCWKDEDAEQTSDRCGGGRTDEYCVCTVQTDDCIWGWVDYLHRCGCCKPTFFFTISKFSICFASCILIITNMKYFKNLNDQTVTPFDFFNMSQLNAKKWCLLIIHWVQNKVVMSKSWFIVFVFL